MNIKFQKIGLFGYMGSDVVTHSLRQVTHHLNRYACKIYLDRTLGKLLPRFDLPLLDTDRMGQQCDLIIVVGGDGSMLRAARVLAQYGKPILGLNRGRLGFLTDVIPSEIETHLDHILKGEYTTEDRFLLTCNVQRQGQVIAIGDALNDIVLHPGKAVQMIDFELYISDQFVYRQHSDGLIVSTPTGSTAYALSAGGAIMHPGLDAIALVPMYPHTLSSRPIVVNGNSEIKIIIGAFKEVPPQLSCDGQAGIVLATDDIVYLQKKEVSLRLVHPLDYNFYQTCRSKLGWEGKMTV